MATEFTFFFLFSLAVYRTCLGEHWVDKEREVGVEEAGKEDGNEKDDV